MLISGKGFNEICNFTFCRRYPNHFDHDISNIEENSKVFLNLDQFWEFIRILNSQRPKNKFILVTHNSDLCFTDHHYEIIKPFVNRVYAINNTCENEDVRTIPLGFRDYPWDTMSVIQQIIPFEFDEKPILCYMNFKINTNIEKRQKCWDAMFKRSWVHVNTDLSLEDYYRETNRSKYVISPPGTGIDCHRVYESIYFNAIPIILRSNMDRYFSKMPVMIITDYEELTQEMLEQRYTDLYRKLIDWKKTNPEWLKPAFWLR